MEIANEKEKQKIKEVFDKLQIKKSQFTAEKNKELFEIFTGLVKKQKT